MNCFPTQKYCIVKQLSSGGFSNVYLVHHQSENYALKVMKKNKSHEKYFENEFTILKSLSHPFICSCFEQTFIFQSQAIVLHFIDGIELYDLLSKDVLSFTKIKIFSSCILSALIYLHDLSIIYRDLKPENVMICKNKAILIDFGFAKIIDTKTKTYCGTLEYMAPEIKNNQSYSFPVDMYAFGVLLYEMYTNQLPFTSSLHIPCELSICISNLLSYNSFDRKTAIALRWSYFFASIDFDLFETAH